MLTRKSEMLARKSLLLTRKSEMLARKSLFPTGWLETLHAHARISLIGYELGLRYSTFPWPFLRQD